MLQALHKRCGRTRYNNGRQAFNVTVQLSYKLHTMRDHSEDTALRRPPADQGGYHRGLETRAVTHCSFMMIFRIAWNLFALNGLVGEEVG